LHINKNSFARNILASRNVYIWISSINSTSLVPNVQGFLGFSLSSLISELVFVIIKTVMNYLLVLVDEIATIMQDIK